MLTVETLTKRYGDETVVSSVSARLQPGEVTVLVGRSGAGKTTLLRCLDGLERPDEGRVRLDGAPLAPADAALVFQSGALVDRKSALENVLDGSLGREPEWRELLGVHSTREKRAAVERLHAVGLAGHADRRVGSLSGGEQQRVGVARALQQEPSVLLADEPVASLDPETARSVLALFGEVVGEHGLVGVVSLHQPRLADEVADRFLGMRAGELVVDVSAEEFDETTRREVYGDG
ncbi:phosphonate ABC transporter ATP-binding protein [Halorubrum gandharaense]